MKSAISPAKFWFRAARRSPPSGLSNTLPRRIVSRQNPAERPFVRVAHGLSVELYRFIGRSHIKGRAYFSAPAANDRLPGMVGASRREPEISHPLGAALATRRPLPVGLPRPHEAIWARCPGRRGLSVFSVSCRQRHSVRRPDSFQRPARRVSDGHARLLDRRALFAPRPHEGGRSVPLALRLRPPRPPPYRSGLSAPQLRLDPAVEGLRLHRGGLCPAISANQRRMARSPSFRHPCRGS